MHLIVSLIPMERWKSWHATVVRLAVGSACIRYMNHALQYVVLPLQLIEETLAGRFYLGQFFATTKCQKVAFEGVFLCSSPFWFKKRKSASVWVGRQIFFFATRKERKSSAMHVTFISQLLNFSCKLDDILLEIYILACFIFMFALRVYNSYS